MSKPILIANGDVLEAKALAAALASQFPTEPVSDLAALRRNAKSAGAVVLDTNFSASQGVDSLLELLALAQLPVLMITPPEDAACAIKALRYGATSYLVKTGTYVELLPMALREAIERADGLLSLKVQLAELRSRNTDLEKRLTNTNRIKRANTTTQIINKRSVTAVRQVESHLPLEEMLVVRLRSGNMQLPAYPLVAMKLRQIMNAEVGMSEVAQLLSQDAAISVKLLRAANAAQYSNLRKVETIDGAVGRIGMNMTCNIAELVTNRSLYATRNATYRTMLDDLWLHSVASAHASEIIARQIGKGSWEKMFSIGLLHDVGKLALLQAVAQSDPEGKRLGGEDNCNSFGAFLEANHVKCGVSLMQQWNFHQDFHTAARYHEDLSGADKTFRTLLIVHLANLVAHAIGYGSVMQTPDELDQAPSKKLLFSEEMDLTPIAEETKLAVEATQQLLA